MNTDDAFVPNETDFNGFALVCRVNQRDSTGFWKIDSTDRLSLMKENLF